MNNSAVKTIPQILKDNVCTVFNLLNLLIAIALAAVGAWKNMLFISVILINTAVGIIREIKAKRQIEKLTLLSIPRVVVLRGDTEIEILPDEIKKGDNLRLESGSEMLQLPDIIRHGGGERVCADGRARAGTEKAGQYAFSVQQCHIGKIPRRGDL